MKPTPKTARQKAVAMILADGRLTGEQKARKINNLIKLTVAKPKETKTDAQLTTAS
jgi:hypothetical protein